MEVARKELEEFFKSGEAGVFVLKGKWGVGKTHLVRDVVEGNSNKQGGIKHAYVSLFGVNSTEELTEAIFVEMATNAKALKKGAGELEDFTKDTGNIFGELFNRTVRLSTKIWMLKAVPKSKIIIDDIERRDEELSIKNLLGFLSQLKEQKNCQIVLVFNEGELDKATQEEFNRYREKVVDREIELIPSVDEIIKLGFKKENRVAVEVLRQLKVDNIRAVQKIEKFLDRLEPLILHLPQEAQNEVISSAVRLSWFYFVRNKDGITWEFIKNFDLLSVYLWGQRANVYGTNRDAPEEESAERKREKKLANRLRQCGYLRTGPLEKMLIEALERGFYNKSELENVLSDIEEKARAGYAVGQLTAAWNILYSSFADNEEEFVAALVKCFEDYSTHYGPGDLENAISVLEELDREREAEAVKKVWRDAPHTFDDVIESVGRRRLKNPEILSIVEEKIQRARQQKDMLQLVDSFMTGSQSLRDREMLQAYTEEDWVNLFKKTRDNSGPLYYVRHILELGGFPSHREVAREAAKALEKIAAESKINKVRLADMRENIERLIESTD